MKSCGFSLIELMVVLAIIAVLMALTGGLVTENVSKRERMVEIEKIAQIFKRLSYKAYYGGYDIKVHMAGGILTIDSNNAIQKVSFTQLTFSPANFLISTKASIYPRTYRVSWNNSYRDFNIPPMFRPHES